MNPQSKRQRNAYGNCTSTRIAGGTTSVPAEHFKDIFCSLPRIKIWQHRSHRTCPQNQPRYYKKVLLQSSAFDMATPTMKADEVEQQTIEVVAPSNLAAGYEFFVNAGNGISYNVRVPNGGAVAGERFNAIVLSQGATVGPHHIPSGRWRDGLCNFCTFGCCHSMCCMAFWCSACALGQVLHRNKLNWIGSPSSTGQAPHLSAFKIFLGISIAVYILDFVIAILTADDGESSDSTEESSTDGESSSSSKRGVSNVLQGILMIVVFIITMRLRSYVRNRYAITGSCIEDCCCSFWCLPCTICQVSRHTADFNVYPAASCSDNGLEAGAPDIV